MNLFLGISMVVIISSCGHFDQKSSGPWKSIEIGEFVFDFPADFNLIAEKGIDSYAGKIVGDSMRFSFDYGHYSNHFEPTRQEYLNMGLWRMDLPLRFMKAGGTYDVNNTPKVEVLTIRPATAQDSTLGKGCDFIANCKHSNVLFDFAIYIPLEIKQQFVSEDTVGQLYRKIVWANEPTQGTTGIYLRSLKTDDKAMNPPLPTLALSMSIDSITTNQQKVAFRIFKSGRLKKEKQ